MKYKLLAIDMDGTFLDGEHKPLEENYIAIKKAAELGIKVVICSGRIPAALKLFTDDMPKNQPIIAGNGSIVYDGDLNEIYKEYIDPDTVGDIISMLRNEYDHVYYHVMDPYVVYSEGIGRIVQDFLFKLNLSLPRKHRMEFRLVPDLVTYIDEHRVKALKIEIHEDDNNLFNEIRRRIETIPNVEVVTSGFGSLEIVRKGINKGKALEVLAKHYGYSLEECIAVGNDENDVEMIQEAGLGIAVKNSNPKAKAVADYITENDNDNNAVAEVVEKFILNVD